MRLKALGFILCTYVLSIALAPAAVPQPLVNLDASGLADTADLQSWTDTGTLGGAFSVKLGTTAITVGTVGGKKAVTFDSNNGLVTDTTTTLITGKAPYTAAIWVYNPSFSDEEWVFQWGARNSNNRAAYIGYGKRSQYSAFGGYGESGDMPFLNGLPAAGAWHHIVVTYDTMIMRLYVDGVLDHAEGKVQDTAYLPYTVGRYYEAAGKGITGSVASVKLYPAALSTADVVSLYVAEGGTTPPADPATPTVLNPSFELPALGSTIDKTISSNSYLMQNWWTNGEGATGITKKNSTSNGWYPNTMTDSGAGSQIFLISNDDSRREVRQLVKGFKAKHAYTVSVLASARVGSYNLPPVMIDINGQGLLDTPQVVPLATGTQNWTTVTSNPWVCPADGAYWVSIHTTQGNYNTGIGNRNTSVLLDNVQINEVTAPPAETLVANPVGGQSWGIATSAASSSAKNIVVTNTGSAAVNVTDVFIDGSSKFTLGTVTPGKSTTLAAGATLTIPVTFNPAGAAAGVYTAKVVVSTNDAVNPTKAYSVAAAVETSAAGKRYVLIDDTGVSLGYNGATGFGQFSGPTALRDANLALNVLTTTATTDILIVDANGLPDTYAADFTVRQPATTIRQVANSQNSDATITLASDASQYDAIVKICQNDCAIKGLDANHKMVMTTRFPVKGLMVGIGGLNSTYSPELAADNFILSDFKFRGYGEGSQSYSPHVTFNRVDWELASGESTRISNPSSSIFGNVQATYNDCTVNHAATNTARFFLPVDSAYTSITWNNCLIAHPHPLTDCGTVWYGNSSSAVNGQSYTYNNCTFDWRGARQPLMSGWTTPKASVTYNNPTFLGPMDSLTPNPFISLTENKSLNVTITGSPNKKVDLTGMRVGVNKLPLIRQLQSTFTLTDCIIDDRIDLVGGKQSSSPASQVNLDRCYMMGDLGLAQANNQIQYSVNATNTIFKTSADTTTSLYLATGAATMANLNHCTFFSNGETTTTPSFIYSDGKTTVTVNNTLVKGPKPFTNAGVVVGATNVMDGAAVNGTNNLTGTIATGPNLDATGHLIPGTLNIQRTGQAPTVNVDYDGDSRPWAKADPIIGADEANLVPVELSTFQAE